LRLATQAEIDSRWQHLVLLEAAQPGRWLAFRAVTTTGAIENALPPASPITVTVEKGTPSAEGPLTTKAAQTFSFQTYSPLRFQGGYCGWRDNRIALHFESWYLEFNNAIDSSKFAKEMVHVEPAVEGLNIYPSGNYIYLTGYKKGRSTYKVTVDGTLSDVFGQSLGQAATATIRVGSAKTNLYAQGGPMTVLDPTAKTDVLGSTRRT
jgi:hypothetical protein